jgi:hypothetical protein
MKKCKICDLEKDLFDFKKDNRTSDGCSIYCKNCMRMKGNEYYHRTKNDRRDKINENRKITHYKNKEKENLKSKEYKINNKDKIKEYNRSYRENNLEKCKNISKEYRKNNIKKIKEYQKLYLSKRLDSDNLFKITHYVRNMIRKSLKRNIFSKKSKTSQILGCSFDEFKIYLESKFDVWMSWENYGKYNGDLNYGWDIDHVIPLSSAKTEEELIKLNHYTNLQPLCSKVNREIKRNILDYF